MTTTQKKARAIFFSILMIVSMVGGSVAFKGLTAAANSDVEPAGNAAETNLVVDNSNSDSYDSIQNAVDDASGGDTIEVRPGTYTESVVISKNITLTAPDGATIENDSISSRAGIQVFGTTTPTISGFTLTGWQWGFSAGGSRGAWTLRDTVITDTELGIGAAGTPAPWTVANVTVANATSGLSAYQSSGDWVVRDSAFQDSGGVSAGESSGGWTIERTTIQNSTDEAIDAVDSGGRWRVNDVTLTNNADGIETDGSTDSWIIQNSVIENTTDDGVSAERTGGNWIIEGVSIRDAGDQGIEADDSDSKWTVRDTAISDTGDDGVHAENTSGNWTLDLVSIENTGDDAVDASGANEKWTIRDSVLQSATGSGIAADGAVRGNATRNYWGAPDGPSGEFNGSGTAAVGDVSISPFYTDSARTTLSEESSTGVDPSVQLDAFDGSRRVSDGEVTEEDTFRLEATISHNNAANNFTYNFTQVSGPSVRPLYNLSASSLAFQPPDISEPETVEFRVNASNSNAVYSDTVAVTITPTPERSLNLSEPQPEYVVSAEVDLQSPAPGDADEVALYAKTNENNPTNTSQYGLVSSNGISAFNVNDDSTVNINDVLLPEGEEPGNDILVSYGLHEMVLINASAADRYNTDGTPDSVLPPEYVEEEIKDSSKTTATIDVVPPRLNASLEPTDGQIPESQSLVNISGDAPGQYEVLFVVITDSGETSAFLLDVQESGTYNETQVVLGPYSSAPQEASVHIVSTGRDGIIGDGRLPDSEFSSSYRIDDFAAYLDQFSAEQDIDGEAIRQVLYNQTVRDDAPPEFGTNLIQSRNSSDDLLVNKSITIINERAEGDESQQVDIDPGDLSGTGTENDPYEISNASELQAMEDDLDANYELVADIDASQTAQWNNRSGFDPVGFFTQSTAQPFSGSFDGNNHTITGLTIDRPDETGVGLFGFADNEAPITNITVTELTVTGNNTVGGVVGFNSGTGGIQNTKASGSVTGTDNVGGIVGFNNGTGEVQTATASGNVAGDSAVGGLVGTNKNGTIQAVSASGSVTGNITVGGLTGLNSGTGEIHNATASANVSAENNAGGLVGQQGGGDGPGGSIQNAAASGSVTGNNGVGGLVGRSFNGTIQATRASGDVTGEDNVGGLIGANSGTVRDTFAVGPVTGENSAGGLIGHGVGTVEESYFDTQGTGQSTSAGSAIGLTTTQMRGQAAAANMSGLEFGTTWETQPDGYPTLIALQQESDQPEIQDAAFTLSPQATASSTVNAGLGDETRPAVVATNVTSNVDGAIVVVYEVSQGADRVAGVRETTTTETNGDSVTVPLENTSGLPGPHYAVFLNESTLNSTDPSPGDVLPIQAEEEALATQPSLQSSSFYRPIYDGEINITDQEFTGSTTEITVNRSALRPDAPSGYVVVLHDQSRAGGTPVGPPIGTSRVLNGTQTNISITLNAGEEINTTRDIVAMLHFAESGGPGQAIPNADENNGLVAGNVADDFAVTIREDSDLELAITASNDSVVAGDDVSVTANITNIDESARGEQIEFVVDGTTVETRTIDPSVNKTDYNVSGQRGVALAGDSIYVTEDDTILEIDRATGETISEFSAPEGTPRGLTYADGSLWFTDTTENNFEGGIVELNPETGEVRSRITNDRYDPTDLAYADGSLWVLEVTLNSVRELDPDTGEQLSQFDVTGPLGTTGPRGLSYQNDTLWVGTTDTNELGQFTTDGNLIQRTGTRNTGYRSLASDGATLYGPGTDGNLTVLRQFDDTDQVSGEQTTETFVYQTNESDVPEITVEVASESANDSVDISVEEPVAPDPTNQLEVANVQGPTTIGQTQRLSVSATVANPTSSNVTESVSFVFDTDQDGTRETIDTRELTLASETNTTVGFTAPSSLEAGAYTYGIVAANETQRQLTVVGTEFKTAVSTGDPHIVTFDDVAYDYMAAGEYTLVREPTGSLEIQARQEPVASSDSVTINTALATTLDGNSVVIDATDSTPVQIDGTPTPIEDGTTVAVGDGAIERTGSSYVIVYPGENGEPDPTDERVIVDMFDNRIDIEVRLDPDRSTPVEGVLGNVDGNSSNDITFANGTVVSNPSDPNALYGPFRDDWRVTENTTLFEYEGDNGPETYYDPAIPRGSFTVDNIDPDTRAEAEELAADAGLTPGTSAYRNALVDYALTGDESYFSSAQQQNASTDVNETITPSVPPELNGSNTLSVTATNASGDIVPGAEIKLYNDSFVILDSRRANESGVASWSTLTAGEYNVELYGPEGAFWGGAAVTVGTDGASTAVQRTAPQLSRINLDGDENGEGGFYGGRPITISPKVQNDGPERPVRVRIQVDTNNDDSPDENATRGGFGTSISSGESGFYGYEYDPSTNGTKQVQIVTEAYINGNWTVTDSSSQDGSFEVENNIIGYDPQTGEYNNQTTISTSQNFLSSSATLPDGIQSDDFSLFQLFENKQSVNISKTDELTKAYPWSATGSIASSDGSELYPLYPQCSGAVIEDRHVVTAGHCIREDGSWKRMFNANSPQYPVFSPGKTPSTSPLGNYNITHVQIYNRYYESDNRSYDIAVVTLNQSVASQTGTFGYESNPASSYKYRSDSLHLTGYPNDQNASYVQNDFEMWDLSVSGDDTNIATDIIPPLDTGCRQNLCHDFATGAGIGELNTDGMSGGPVWRANGAEPIIISTNQGGVGLIDMDSIGVRISENKYDDIGQMIDQGYAQPEVSTANPNPGLGTPAPPDGGGSGSATGDPHLTTYDGVAYDFQAAGEFVLTNHSDGNPYVQARLRPVADRDVSVISAVATQLNGTSVTIDARDEQMLTVDGTSQSLDTGESMTVGDGEIFRTPETYIVVYPGEDGEVDDGDSRLEATVAGDRLDVVVKPNRTAVDSMTGLLGSPDGNPDNDLMRADGTTLSTQPSFEALYGQYREGYRVTAENSLFDYEDGESAAGFYDPNYPSGRVTVDDLPADDREAAIEAATNAGLEPGTAHFRDAVIDYALTEDQSFIASASRAADETEVTTDVTPTETTLTAPELTVETDSERIVTEDQLLNVAVAATHPDPGNVRVIVANGTETVFEENVSDAFDSEQTVSWDTTTNGETVEDGVYTLGVIATSETGVRNVTTRGLIVDNTAPTVTLETTETDLNASANNTTVTFGYTDPVSGVDAESVTVLENGTDVTETATINSSAASYELTGLEPESTRTVEIRVSNEAGLTANQSVTVSVAAADGDSSNDDSGDETSDDDGESGNDGDADTTPSSGGGGDNGDIPSSVSEPVPDDVTTLAQTDVDIEVQGQRGVADPSDNTDVPVESIVFDAALSGNLEIREYNTTPSEVAEPPVEPDSIVEIAVPPRYDDESAEVRFAVDDVTDSAEAVDTENLTVWQHTDGEWRSLDSEISERSDGSLVVQAETPALSMFVISVDETPSTADESTESDDVSESTDESTTEDADEETDSNTESTSDDGTDESAPDEPFGTPNLRTFGIIIALLALIMAGLFARRLT